VHLAGRGDFTSCFVVEIPAGGQLHPERHVFDKTYYVFQGRGSTTIELPDGGRHSFEWGPGSMFGIPLNARHQLFNGSGSEPARLAACTNLPIYVNLTNDVGFLFDNPYHFRKRLGEDRYFRGEGEFRKVRPGRHQWETNFVPDILGFELPEWQERGAGGRNIMFELADSPMHIHLSEFPVGTYKKAHRHNAGAHIFIVTGQGYSNLWLEGQSPVDTIHLEWKVGSLFAPPDGPTYHQHFNTAQAPSRYLVMTGTGSARYPVWESRRKTEQFRVTDKSIKEGGNQVEYEFEDPRVLEAYERECARHGVQSRMRALIEAAKEKAHGAAAGAYTRSVEG
jgi:mannose-6-phosphate isomerase-like protein (cupin superfamily)